MRRLRGLARLLDSAITIPGLRIRIGLDAIVGLIPGIGDLVMLAPSSYLLVQAAMLGVPASTLLLMTYNLALELLVGGIPIVGDVFDAVWKANLRNLHLLERHLDAAGATPAPSNRGLMVFLLVAIVLLVGAIALAAYVMSLLARQFS